MNVIKWIKSLFNKGKHHINPKVKVGDYIVLIESGYKGVQLEDMKNKPHRVTKVSSDYFFIDYDPRVRYPQSKFSDTIISIALDKYKIVKR